jgi:hypothetical protein
LAFLLQHTLLMQPFLLFPTPGPTYNWLPRSDITVLSTVADRVFV